MTVPTEALAGVAMTAGLFLVVAGALLLLLLPLRLVRREMQRMSHERQTLRWLRHSGAFNEALETLHDARESLTALMDGASASSSASATSLAEERMRLSEALDDAETSILGSMRRWEEVAASSPAVRGTFDPVPSLVASALPFQPPIISVTEEMEAAALAVLPDEVPRSAARRAVRAALQAWKEEASDPDA